MFKKILCTALAFVFIASSAFAGTATVSSRTSTVWGNKRVVMGIMTLSGAYGASGISCSAKKIGLTKVDYVVFIPTSDYDDLSYEYSSGYIKIYSNLVSTNKPITVSVAAADTFKVLNKALTAADVETALVIVKPITGQIAQLGLYDALAATASSDIKDVVFSSGAPGGDTSKCAVMSFDTTTPGVDLRGKLVGADTVFFDYNTTGRENRLMYSGTALGSCGDLYVPFPTGNYIKITKKTNSQITTAAAAPLYFIRSKASTAAKFQADVTGTGNNNSGFMCDSTYTSLPQYKPDATSLNSTESVSAVVKFIAVGQ